MTTGNPTLDRLIELRRNRKVEPKPQPELPPAPDRRFSVLKIPDDLFKRLDRSRDVFQDFTVRERRMRSANSALLKHAVENGVKIKAKLAWS